tara:strand:+ start:153 stop:566 length:414 start_codon:yes stop_codon:yes gene_type:complete
MKTIKLTILGILLSTVSFSQLKWNFEIPDPNKITDSLCYNVSENSVYEFDPKTTECINTRTYKEYDYIEFILDSNQVMRLNFYDNCKSCEVKGKRFMIVFGRKGEISKGYFRSKPGHFMIYGDVVKKVVVSKPIENE